MFGLERQVHVKLATRRTAFAGMMMAALAGVMGCGNFFVPNTTTTTTAAGSTGDYVYVVNQASDTLSGFSVASSALTAVTGSPYGLLTGLAPSSVTVSRPNTFVYVGGLGAIELFSIGTGGVLTLVNSSAISTTAKFVSMDTSPDGQWLLALDGLTQTVDIFGINTSTGALTLNSTTAYVGGGGTVVPTQIRISANGAYVAAALGTGGDAIFTFDTTTGVLTQPTGDELGVNAGYTDNALTFDSTSSYLYIARGGPAAGLSGVTSFSVTTGAALTQVQALVTSGNAPFSILLDATGSYLYTANRGDGTVSGFKVATGMLTAITGSPFAGGGSTTALVEENSDKYVIAANFAGSPDLQLYTFDTSTGGKLDSGGTAVSGTDPAGSFALAATH